MANTMSNTVLIEARYTVIDCTVNDITKSNEIQILKLQMHSRTAELRQYRTAHFTYNSAPPVYRSGKHSFNGSIAIRFISKI